MKLGAYPVVEILSLSIGQLVDPNLTVKRSGWIVFVEEDVLASKSVSLLGWNKTSCLAWVFPV